MKRERLNETFRKVILASISLFIISGLAISQSFAATKIGRVSSTKGKVKISRSYGSVDSNVKVGTDIFVGDEIATGKRGFIRILLDDNSVFTIGSVSRVVMDDYVLSNRPNKRRGVFRLLVGRLKAVVSRWSQKGATDYRVKTPSAVAGVRGTSFILWVDAEGYTDVLTLTGKVEVAALDQNMQPVETVVLTQRTASRVGGGSASQPRGVSQQEVDNANQQFDNSGGGQVGNLLDPVGDDDDDDDDNDDIEDDDDDDDSDDDDDDNDSSGDDDDDDSVGPLAGGGDIPGLGDGSGGIDPVENDILPEIGQEPTGSAGDTTRVRMNFEIQR
jgi:FecR protein